MLKYNFIMTRKSLPILIVLFLFFGLFSSAQNNQEREHRIKKSQFPLEALQLIEANNDDFKRIKYYKAIDSTSKTFIAKFKKDRLFYSMNFNETGVFKGLGFAIKPVDMPDESFSRITAYLDQTFEKSKIRKMFQTYSIQPDVQIEKTLKNAFQNLMLPHINYALFIKGKKDGVRDDFEVSFDAKGNLIQLKKALPTNYDRVLY